MSSKKLPTIKDQQKKDWLLLILGLMGGKAGLDMSKQAFQLILSIIVLIVMSVFAICVLITLKILGAI